MSDANPLSTVTVRPLSMPQENHSVTPLPLRLLRLIVDHNPFFLLSGVCMLAGCYLINGAMHEVPDRLGVLLGLLGVFNVYEVAVIALAGYLLHRRGLVRHAGWLLLLEMLLLTDTTLLYQEVATASAWAGVLVGIAAAVVVMVKLAVIFAIARLRLRPAAWCILLVNFIAILGMPVLWRALSAGERLHPGTMMLFWWVGGATLALAAWPTTWWTSDTGTTGLPGLRRALGWSAIAMPALSVLGHLWAGLYVYDVPMDRSYLAPVALGAAMLFMRVMLDRCPPAYVRRAVLACVGVAILLCLKPANDLAIAIDGWLIVSPLRLTLLAGSGIAMALWSNVGGAWLLGLSPLLALTTLLGHDPGAMAATLQQWRLTLAGWHDDLRPRSTFSWGVLTVSLAFVFLGCGMLLSLLKRQTPTSSSSASPPPPGLHP